VTFSRQGPRAVPRSELRREAKPFVLNPSSEGRDLGEDSNDPRLAWPLGVFVLGLLVFFLRHTIRRG
jgi:hypothetical protein